MDLYLGQWDGESKDPMSKISFVHFPMSFIASTDTREHCESVFVNHFFSTYILQPLTCNVWEASLKASLL